MSSLSGTQYIGCSKELALPLGDWLPLFTELPTERAHSRRFVYVTSNKVAPSGVLWSRHIILNEKITTRRAVVWRFGVLEEQRAGSLLLGLPCPVVAPSYGGYTLVTYKIIVIGAGLAGKFVEDEELRQAMKESGLGTPATRAATIERLLKVGYLVRDKKALVPIEKGRAPIGLLGESPLASPELTARWEERLARMEKGAGSRGGVRQGGRESRCSREDW